MLKPSKKVASIMIIVGAVTVASIGSDIVKKNDLAKKSMALVSGIFEQDTSVKSIDQYMVEKISDNSSIATSEFNPKTVTEYALIELFGNYKNLKDQSLNTPENISELTSRLAESTRQYVTIPTKYSVLEIKTFPDYKKEEAKSYGNEFAHTLEIFFKQGALLNESDSMQYVKKYAEIQEKYASTLTKLEVPRSISDEHTDFANNIYKISIALPKLASIEDDPLLYSFISHQHKTALEKNTEILKKIASYFELNGIIFSDDEPGAMWNAINEKYN